MRQDRKQSLNAAIGCSTRFTGDKERLEQALWGKARISAEVTFAEGKPVITLLGADKGNYGLFLVARKIVREMGYGEAK